MGEILLRKLSKIQFANFWQIKSDLKRIWNKFLLVWPHNVLDRCVEKKSGAGIIGGSNQEYVENQNFKQKFWNFEILYKKVWNLRI